MKSHVLVVGVGGVGGNAAECLVRGGVGRITLIDGDTVDPTNRNRQLVALTSTEGQGKSEALAQRLRDINPAVVVEAIQTFLTPDSAAVDALISGHSPPLDFVVRTFAPPCLLLAWVQFVLPGPCQHSRSE
jgi:tRNA A37 threonylcarbamoyladenosine dehydratase